MYERWEYSKITGEPGLRPARTGLYDEEQEDVEDALKEAGFTIFFQVGSNEEYPGASQGIAVVVYRPEDTSRLPYLVHVYDLGTLVAEYQVNGLYETMNFVARWTPVLDSIMQTADGLPELDDEEDEEDGDDGDDGDDGYQ
jgi:hypothetical protein